MAETDIKILRTPVSSFACKDYSKSSLISFRNAIVIREVLKIQLRIKISELASKRVKEAIQIRLHSNNINRDSGIEIPEAWIPPIRKHNSRSTTMRTLEGTSSVSRNNNEDRNAPITANQRA